LLLVLALLQAAGIADLVRRETCEAECERNGCQDCTPGDDGPQCPCHCPNATNVTAPSLAVVTNAPAMQSLVVAFVRDDRTHSSPDPREILHVPRSYAV